MGRFRLKVTHVINLQPREVSQSWSNQKDFVKKQLPCKAARRWAFFSHYREAPTALGEGHDRSTQKNLDLIVLLRPFHVHLLLFDVPGRNESSVVFSKMGVPLLALRSSVTVARWFPSCWKSQETLLLMQDAEWEGLRDHKETSGPKGVACPKSWS